MVTQNDNPFVLPGFGQSGDMAQNPLVASMEMMRQAWEGLASSGGLNQAAMTTPMSVEELERRIGDLRAVENWLRMNLSMLSSTIQGLEVQRSTIATLKTFMASANVEQPSAVGAQDIAATAATAAQGWWDMVQKQFDSLAAATAASLKGAEAAAGQQASADTTMGAKSGATGRKTASNSAASTTAAKKAAPRKRAAPARNKA